MYTAVQSLWNCCRKFSEIRATRWLLWHSDFTKFNFSRGSAPDLVVELTTFPIPPTIVGFGTEKGTLEMAS